MNPQVDLGRLSRAHVIGAIHRYAQIVHDALPGIDLHDLSFLIGDLHSHLLRNRDLGYWATGYVFRYVGQPGPRLVLRQGQIEWSDGGREVRLQPRERTWRPPSRPGGWPVSDITTLGLSYGVSTYGYDKGQIFAGPDAWQREPFCSGVSPEWLAQTCAQANA